MGAGHSQRIVINRQQWLRPATGPEPMADRFRGVRIGVRYGNLIAVAICLGV
jgi:hypothetical protein